MMMNEHFDVEGRMKENDVGCVAPVCEKARRIKIISTETN